LKGKEEKMKSTKGPIIKRNL